MRTPLPEVVLAKLVRCGVPQDQIDLLMGAWLEDPRLELMTMPVKSASPRPGVFVAIAGGPRIGDTLRVHGERVRVEYVVEGKGYYAILTSPLPGEGVVDAKFGKG